MQVDLFKTAVIGQVKIYDRATGDLLIDKRNAIHPGNMAVAIARGLANSENHQIYKLKLGNRGTYLNTNQQIVFNSPNVIGTEADLYNATYAEVVDDQSTGVGGNNSVVMTAIPNSLSTRVIVTCVVAANEPSGQNSLDTNNDGQIATGSGADANVASPYFFDELGLFTKQTSGTDADLNPAGELMLSHVIFSPIEKSANRELVIVYSLTVTVTGSTDPVPQ